MVVIARAVAGCVLIAIASAATVWVVTYSSRSRLLTLSAEASNLAKRHEELSSKIGTFVSEGSIVALPDEVVWKDRDGLSAEIALQQTLVASAEKSGLRLISFGAGATATEIGIPTVVYEMEMSGEHTALVRFLADVEVIRPALAVSYLWLRQLPTSEEMSGAPISIRMSVWGFRETKVVP